MKNYSSEKEAGMLVFYVMLENQTERKSKSTFAPSSKSNLMLVVNR